MTCLIRNTIRSKNSPQRAAGAVCCGGAKVVHRRSLSFVSRCLVGGFMGHRRDVPSGDLWPCAAFGAGGGTEPARGSAGVWDLAQDDPEDASLCGSAGISAVTAASRL